MPNSHCFYFFSTHKFFLEQNCHVQLPDHVVLGIGEVSSSQTKKKLDQWVLPEVDQLRPATIQNQHSLTTRITSKCTTINSHFTNMTLCVPSFAICHHLRQPAAASGSSASAPTRVSFCAAQRNRARKCARFYLIIGN